MERGWAKRFASTSQRTAAIMLATPVTMLLRNAPAVTGEMFICAMLTMELTHAGPKDAAREAELGAPSGVVRSDFVRPLLHCGLQ